MTKKYIYLLLTALILLSGCIKEVLVQPEDLYEGDGREVDVSLQVFANGMNVLSNTKALDELGERNVQDLYVAFFPVSGTSDAPVIGNKIFGEYYSFDDITKIYPEEGHYDAGYVSIHNVPTGTYYIIGVANVEFGAHAGFKDDLEKAVTWAEFHDIAVTLRDDPVVSINVDRNTPALCMSGYYRDPHTSDNVQDPAISAPFAAKVDRNGTLPGYIHLRRLDSHITFVVRNEIPNCKAFSMIDARMFNVPKSSRLMEDEDDYSVAYITTESKKNAWQFRPKTPGSLDEDKKYDSYTWSLYMMENRGDALTPEGYDELSTYRQRELEYKNEDGTNHHEDGDRVYDYVYAPDNAAFLEFNASMEQTMADGDETFSRVANMKYVVHLGYCEGDDIASKSKDFNNRRNTKYTYIIHIRGVNDIVVEAVSDELYDDTFSHGVEGNVIDLRSGQVQQIDSHFGVFNISLTRHQIAAMLIQIKSWAGEWSSVPTRNEFDINDPVIYAKYLADPESFFPFPNYLSEDYQAIRISPLPAGLDPEKRLVSYSETYDFDWPQGQASWTKPTTLLPMHGECKIQQDAEHTNPVFDLLSFKKAFATPKSATNPWGYEVDGLGRGIDMDTPLYFTVFVNEYFYYYENGIVPADRQIDSDGYPVDADCKTDEMWHSIANTGHRFFRLLSDGYDSVDNDSHYLTGSIHVEQRALQTYYSKEVSLAVAMEHVNEHHWKLMTQTRNNLRNYGHGWMAATSTMTGNDANNWRTIADQTTKIGEGYPAFATKSYTTSTGTASLYNYRKIGNNSDITAGDKWTDRHYFPTSGSDIDRNYYEVEEAALSRNRDLNRDGKITEDELRWYLPFAEEYVNFAVGQGALESPLFSRKDYSAEAVGNEQVYSNRRYHYIGADWNYLWAEEGTSVGGGVMGWEIRCCRLLGARDDDYRNNHSLSLPYDYNPATRVFSTSKFAEKGIHRGYTKGALQPHDNLELEANALPYHFKMAKVDSPLKDVIVESGGKTRQQVLWNRMVTNEYCRNYTEDPEATFNSDGTVATANDKGAWHAPNQMELALMFYGPKIRPSDGQFISSTYWWRNDGVAVPEGVVANNTTDYRHYMGANGSNLRMLHTGADLYRSKMIVRCVLDCDADGRPVDTPAFGNPIEFVPNEKLVACTYEGDTAHLGIGASMSGGVVKSVTVNGVAASVSGGLVTLSTADIPVVGSTASVVWKIEYNGKILTYSHEYQLPARYWMISRYNVNDRYATVNQDNNRTYIGVNDYRNLDDIEAIYKWVITKDPVGKNPVNESELEVGVTYYVFNAGTEQYISGPTSGSQSYMVVGGTPMTMKLVERPGYSGYYMLRFNDATFANANGGVNNFGTWTNGYDDGSTYKLSPAVMRGEMPLEFVFDEHIIVEGDRYSVHITASDGAVPVNVTIDGQRADVTGSNGDFTATIVTSSVSGANIVTSWTMSYLGSNITKTKTYVLPANYWAISRYSRDGRWASVDSETGRTRRNQQDSRSVEQLPAEFKWIITTSTGSIVNETELRTGVTYYLYNAGAQEFINGPKSPASYMTVGSGPMPFQLVNTSEAGYYLMKFNNTNLYANRNGDIDDFGFSSGTDSGSWYKFTACLNRGEMPLSFKFASTFERTADGYAVNATMVEGATVTSAFIAGRIANITQTSATTWRASIVSDPLEGDSFETTWRISFNGEQFEKTHTYDIPHTYTASLMTFSQINAMSVGERIRVVMANPSSTRKYFLGHNGTSAVTNTHTGYSNQATIDNIANEAAADRVCRFYLTRTASGYTLTSEINGFSPNRSGNGVVWQNNTANVFTLSNPNVSDGALLVSQPTNASFIRFTNNGSYLNADGPKYATGIGAWSMWYVYKVIVE